MRLSLLLSSVLGVETLASSIPAIRSGIKPKPNQERIRSNYLAKQPNTTTCDGSISPKFFIISLFISEGEVWYRESPDLLARNITIPGLSPLFPQAHCTANGDVCQLITGEGEINAASSITALWSSHCFNLTSTYFMVAGIAGINPHEATTGSVTFSKYAVQFDLQYEFSQAQIPANDSSGYFPQDSVYPDEYKPRDYPGAIYGTEVFELNNNLKKRAVKAAKKAKLYDTTAAEKYRKKFDYAPGNQPPSVVECDTGTSNNYWSGSVLGDAFSNYTKLLTNGSGTYCATQQEDNGVLEALLRGNLAGQVDFSRVIVMRTASDFDRAPPDETTTFHLLFANQHGFEPSIQNIHRAGVEVVKDVVENWEGVYKNGVKADNYVGDLFNSLDSKVKPDIGTPEVWLYPA